MDNGIQSMLCALMSPFDAHKLREHFPHGPYNIGASDRGSITVPCMRAQALQFHLITVEVHHHSRASQLRTAAVVTDLSVLVAMTECTSCSLIVPVHLPHANTRTRFHLMLRCEQPNSSEAPLFGIDRGSGDRPAPRRASR